MVALRICIFIPLIVFLSGCSFHAVDLEPESRLPKPGSFNTVAEPAVPVQAPWWTSFNDVKLNGILNEALYNNFEVAQALARFEQASALTRQARAVRFPAVDVQGIFGVEWEDNEDLNSLTEAGGLLAWELDVFDRLGAAENAFKQELTARSEDIESVKLTLSADIAETYYGAIEQRQQLLLLKEQVERDQTLLELTELRFIYGGASAVDVLQQRGQLAETESLIPIAEGELRVLENRLDVLLGVAPDTLDRTSDSDRFPDIEEFPSTGVPSELLVNRPDLRALKYDLVAADYRIGQAIAERLPRITLTGSYAFTDGPGLTGPLGLILSTFVQPLLDWGLREAEVRRNKALYQERLAQFTQAYLSAIEDVENALYLEKKHRTLIERLTSRQRILAQTLVETRNRYIQGLTDYLPVLTAVQDLRDIDREIITRTRELVQFRVRLYRALGGPVTSKSDDGLNS